MCRIILCLVLCFAPSICFARDFSSWLDACDMWRDSVIETLERESVDTDYYYLMVAESRCNIGAESGKGAMGFWQMMPATGKHYGCGDLNDIECSTMAAIRYIKHLSETFRTFRDVVYAWNMGGHNYRRFGASYEAKSLYSRVMEIKKYDSERLD